MREFKTAAFRAPLILILLVFTCLVSSLSYGAEVQPSSEKKEAIATGHDYLIGPEDVLEISVWKNADLSKTVNVRPDGKISLPLLGDIKAGGLTPNQLKDEISTRLKAYQETAVVSVIVASVNSYRIFIVGEVRSPGVYQLKARTSILQALAIAGGFTQFASKNKIRLVRVKSDGTEESTRVRFDDLVYGDDEEMQQNLILKAGDTILVP